ncbi:hypothetical protein EYC80_005852 [Monilinia laxa]|uniref:Uncharacterized protein n=1 Tax=Monilinia laxa TaxID=61186 RepID=A0A5N6KFH4_MONLA|nr:hypothetical protein EYC80_005852 [Monilinia laxa]
MFSAEGGPYQNRPTDSRSRPHQDNPFDDSNYTRLSPSYQGGIHAQEAGGSSISRIGQANRSSVGMARGSSSKGPGTFRNRELIQESLHSNGDMFDLSISSQNEYIRSVDNSPKDRSSPEFTGTHHTSAFLPQSYGLTRSQLMNNHSANDTDSFAFEGTYERYHTARDLQGTQQNRSGTPPTVSANYYHESPSYSIRGDTSGAYSTPVLVAKGPGSNAARAFGGSSTISFTNTVLTGMRVVNDNTDMLSSVNCPKATNLMHEKKEKKKKSKFSPNSTATSAVSDNQLYSGLNDAQLGFYMSTYNGGEPSNFHRPKVAKTRGFPKELPPRPQPVRVTAEARAQYNARKEDQRLARERRLAVPHLIRRSSPVSNGWGKSLELLTRNAWILVVVASFGLLSMVICSAVIITIKSVGEKSSEHSISVPIIWWLATSALIFCGGIVSFVVLRVRSTPRRSEIGFRNRVGPNEIIDGTLRHGGELESGFNGQSFEMVSGSHLPRYGRFGTTNGSPAPRQEALSSFDTPKTVQDVHQEVPHRNFGRLERVPIASYDFKAAPIRGTGEESYFGGRFQSSGESDHTGFMANRPGTPLTPLPQAVLSPTTPRYINNFSVSHYRTPSRPCAPISIPTPGIPDIPEDPEAVSMRVSTRSRDSLVAAGPHRDQALKSLLGETPAPDEILGITNIYDGNRQSIGSAPSSLTSTYSFVPSPLKRVETEGPLAKLEKSLTHQSQKIATEQEPPVLSRNPWRESMSDNDEILPATFYTRNNKGKGRAYD